ncbi:MULTISPECIES: glycosyltransferase family 4 protein [unclassified Rhodococcus (in: high G+C Gram-positive bacteria)]|uniref:glycosyltransferase family 4 protein n=1 Tax=unclassified Rhodococcus (in: high G+C Gram-positive bacteria) TaxID=192944 RepID=UPI0012F6EC5B|nr:glycosyltransferase family 4 protein [Rhodococcus sp. DK17]
MAKNARRTACFDRQELERYIRHGVNRVDLLNLTLPPDVKADVKASGRTMLFIGDQTWWPNYEAVARLVRLWPSVTARVPGARLNIIGKMNPRAKWKSVEGIKHWGFVDDLSPFLSQSRAMIAPISTGGGVRVKLLEACSRGLPVVATQAAIGSLDEVLGLPVSSNDDDLVDESVRMLLDPAYAAERGDEIYDTNSGYWRTSGPHNAVASWLSA